MRESAPKFMLQPVAAPAPRYAIGRQREVRQDVLARRAVPWLREELDDRRLDPRKGHKSKKGKGRGRSAEAILKALFDLGPHPPQAAVFSACWPGLASWERNPRAATAVLAGLGKRGLWDVALKVTRFMQHHSLDINCFHYTSVISACERRGKWEIALTLLSSMKEEEVLPSEVTYNAAISACAKGGEWSVALQLLKEMSLDDVMPDCVSYNAASSACASAGLWNSSLHLLQEMCTSTVPPSVVTFSTLLSACEKGKQWQMAINTLFHPPVPALMPDKICFTTVISACEKAREWETALLCFRHMDTRDLQKDDICFHSVISSCIRARAWSQALSLALEMEALPLEVNGILWGGVATAMQQSGQPIAQLSSRLRRKWARQQSSRSSGLLPVALSGIGESREHEVHVLDQAEGLLAAFKPTGLSTEAALQRLLHLLTKEGYTGHLSRASRLDGATSGVIPVALGESDSPASNWLNYQFAARMVSKEYVCLCSGLPFGARGTRGAVTASLVTEKSRGVAQLKVVWASHGKEARTEYELMDSFVLPEDIDAAHPGSVLSLLRVKPLTGRTHQIRTHLAGIGRPILGDRTYGGLAVRWCARLFLHCRRISVRDLANKLFQPVAPLPRQLESILEDLRSRTVGLGSNLPEFDHRFLGRIMVSIPPLDVEAVQQNYPIQVSKLCDGPRPKLLSVGMQWACGMGNSACCTGAEASADHEQKELTRKEAVPGAPDLPGPDVSAPMAAQASPGEYVIQLDRKAGGRLGIDVDHKDGETLLIEVINEGLVMELSLAPALRYLS
ncbi:unnamed protein product [Symbiodinium sp. CCMP2592]|nr:unnamed protein product [Symbiodinium sp. CCMP2592]